MIHQNKLAVLGVIILAISCVGCSPDMTNKKSKDIPETNAATNNVIKGKFTPPSDKTLLIIGQDSDTISEYIVNMSEDNIEGVTLYSQLKSNDINQTLYGIVNKGFWHAGDVDFNKTLNESPDAALALGLALDTCNQENHPQKLVNGEYNDALNTLVDYLKALSPRKVFLRIGYEFDGPWNCYQPESYKAAFQTISKALKQSAVDNVATVWQSAVWPDGYGNPDYNTVDPDHFARWYPGDDYVDWVGISVFYRDLSRWNYQPPTTPAAGQQAAINFAKSKSKPVMVSESAPQGFRIEQLTVSPIHQNIPEPITAEEIWQQWYVPYFEFLESNKDIIRAVAYINTHWESQGMWKCQPGITAGQEGCNQGNWGDSRVHSNPYIKQRWLEQVNDESRWVQSSQYE